MPNFQEPSSGTASGLIAPEIVNSRILKDNFTKSMQEGIAEQYAHADPNRAYNPPFDSRAWQQPVGGMGPSRAPKLLRGRMSMWKTEPNKLPIANAKLSRWLNFLYNPTTISHSFAFNGDVPPPDAANADDPARPLMEGQSVSWKLLFNRQYESAYGVPDRRGAVPDKGGFSSGVLQDTTALQYMLGTYNGSAMLSTLIVVMFGATQGNKPFAYFGWITACEINYLMFNHRMIPTVAEVDLTLARRVVPESLSEGYMTSYGTVVTPASGSGLGGTSASGSTGPVSTSSDRGQASRRASTSSTRSAAATPWWN